MVTISDAQLIPLGRATSRPARSRSRSWRGEAGSTDRMRCPPPQGLGERDRGRLVEGLRRGQRGRRTPVVDQAGMAVVDDPDAGRRPLDRVSVEGGRIRDQAARVRRVRVGPGGAVVDVRVESSRCRAREMRPAGNMGWQEPSLTVVALRESGSLIQSPPS
jgi:hypothetical protein